MVHNESTTGKEESATKLLNKLVRAYATQMGIKDKADFQKVIRSRSLTNVLLTLLFLVSIPTACTSIAMLSLYAGVASFLDSVGDARRNW